MDNDRLLRRRMRGLGYDVVETTRDGNCFFDALRQMVPQPQGTGVATIRQDLVNHIEGHQNRFHDFVLALNN